MLYMQMLDEEIKKNDKKYAPSGRTSHFHNNLGISPLQVVRQGFSASFRDEKNIMISNHERRKET